MTSPYATPILRWYAASARDLPWRRPGTSAWAVLVSEIMLQQTPVARVLPAHAAWIARWPTPAALAAATPADAVRQWDRLGYPRRAVRLHAIAQALVSEHGGNVPASAQVLATLPGIGPYTAAAVASFAFEQRHAVLDTNVRRVLGRHVGRGAQARRVPAACSRGQGGPLVGRRHGARRARLQGRTARLRILPGRRAVRMATGRLSAARRPPGRSWLRGQRPGMPGATAGRAPGRRGSHPGGPAGRGLA